MNIKSNVSEKEEKHATKNNYYTFINKWAIALS